MRRILADGDPAFVADRTDVVVFNIAITGIQVEVTAYFDVATASAERAARHALMVDVVRLAERCRLTLGLRMQSSEHSASELERLASAP